MKLTKLFTSFFNSEKAAGLILVFCTALSLLIANSNLGSDYVHLWHTNLFGKPFEFWINEVLMTVFFLMVGLEIEREIYGGELASVRRAMLPVMAALGGMIVPAAIHFGFNNGSPTENGFGIPMATDIAFSLGILSLLGKNVPGSLKIFLTALAIIDDLGAILIIAIFYSNNISMFYLLIGTSLFAAMLVMNRLKIYKVWIYLVIGCGLWYCLYKTGIHPTITGVLLAFALPYGSGDEQSPSYNLQNNLHGIVAFGVLPLFALANTAIIIPDSFIDELSGPNSLGIILGLVVGKPVGIFLFAFTGILLGFCSMPSDLKKTHLFGAGLLAGIGFTMSVFITLLAFKDPDIVNISKIAVLIASLIAGIAGYIWLRIALKRKINIRIN